MKKFNLRKDYKHLRTNVFSNLDMPEFLEVYARYRKLSFQYRLLKFADKLEKINIRKSNIPILRFITMCIDLFRWCIYDICLTIINGKIFKPYGLTVYCRKAGGR